MRSSISSSETRSARYWLLVLGLALVCAAALAGGAEWYWRTHGYAPEVGDSAQLWSLQRDRVYDDTRTPLVLLGASHIQYAVNLKLLAGLLPGYKPVMLARNGHYPLAALRDLANDENFRGVVLCDIDARGLSRYYDEAQQPWVDYYHHQWSPSWHVHRVVLTKWQRHAVIGQYPFGVVAEIVRWIDRGSLPWHSPMRFHANRTGNIDFALTDSTAMAHNFVRGFKNDLKKHPPVPPQEWLSDLERVRQWCDKIKSRGGTVIFFRTPTSGALLAAEQKAYPRTEYWDRLSSAVRSPTLYSLDLPWFRRLHLPDDSHVDQSKKTAYTRELTNALARHGWVSSAP